jgi:hypothetical protein
MTHAVSSIPEATMSSDAPEQIKQIQVEAQADHLDSIAKSKPINAVAELIWNALDADADRVEVSIEENALSGIERITVSDNGDGLPLADAKAAFGNLGGSWKKNRTKTKRKGRHLHGRDGEGRFKAFALGDTVIWDTVFEDQGKLFEYTITGRRGNLKAFEIGTLKEVSGVPTGTSVRIQAHPENIGGLSEEGSGLDHLSEQFAIYLRDNPGLKILFRGHKVDPSRVQKAHKEIPLLDIPLGDGKVGSALLEVFEWTTNKKERKIRLCDERGMTLHEVEAGVRPGAEFNFTAYLQAAYIGELHRENLLELEDQTEGLINLLEHARNGLRSYFRERKDSSASSIVQQWKEDGIYPYAQDPENLIEKARREVFDICAINVHEYLDSFRQGSLKDQKFTLLMLKTTLEENPPALKKILTEVLGLPKDRLKDLAELLERNSFPEIIEAAKVVSDRLAFLSGLEKMLFDPESKRALLERSQLHKILETETWIFGEEFHLTASEINLTNVLRKHIDLLRPEGKSTGRKKKVKPEKVLLDEGGEGRIDLMLARGIPAYGKSKKEYLIVELKRPSQDIDLEIKAQIEAYALALVRDEQVDAKNTFWTFIAVSNEITPDAEATLTQTDKPVGFFLEKPAFRVGLTTWAQVIQASRTRLELFKETLGKGADTTSGVQLLNAKYQKYIPDCLKQVDASPDGKTSGIATLKDTAVNG